MTDNEFREQIAALAHEVWASWMRYLRSKCTTYDEPRGTIILPACFMVRWERQMNTPYPDLPEEEKGFDRKIADQYIKLMIQYVDETIGSLTDGEVDDALSGALDELIEETHADA